MRPGSLGLAFTQFSLNTAGRCPNNPGKPMDLHSLKPQAGHLSSLALISLQKVMQSHSPHLHSPLQKATHQPKAPAWGENRKETELACLEGAPGPFSMSVCHPSTVVGFNWTISLLSPPPGHRLVKMLCICVITLLSSLLPNQKPNVMGLCGSLLFAS